MKTNSQGAKSFKILNVKSSILKWMRAPIGSQCKSFMTGVTWSDLIPEKKRVTESEHVAACPFLAWVSHSIKCYNNSSAT